MKTCKLSGARLLRFGLSVSVATAFFSIKCRAAELTITNQSFEDPVLGDGAYQIGSVPGWIGQGTFWVLNPDNSHFSGTTVGSPSNPIDGFNAVGVNNGARLSYQDTNWILQPNFVYSLTFLAGYRIGVPFGTGSVSFWAGTNLLAEKFPTPAQDTFVTSSLIYTSPPSGTVLGMPLRIELRAVGANSQPHFDNFHLFANSLICTPHKATAVAQLVNGILVGATILDPGCGYTNAPTVLVQGGGGNGAAATAIVTNGGVVEVHIDNGGCCYTNLPKIVIGSPPFVPTVGIRVNKVIVTQNVVLGRRYVLESSFDLVTWTPTGPSFIAESETLESEFNVNVTGQFFRLLETF